MAAARASAAGVARIDRHHLTASPCLLVRQLPAELEPALIENRLVESGLGLAVAPRRCSTSRCGLAHIAHLQILDTHHRVVLADRGRGLVQVVAADIADLLVALRDFGFCLLPVVAEFRFARHGPLITSQPRLLLFETVDRLEDSAVREGREAGDAHVDAHDGCGRVNRCLHFPFSLDRDEPFAAVAGHGDVLRPALHVSAVAIAQPAQLGQEDAAIAGIDLELLGIGIAKAIAHALLLEAREVGAFGKEVLVGPFHVFQGMLQRMHGRIGKPARLGAIAPGREVLCHRHIADECLTGFVVCLLQRQRLVKHEPARPREAAHEALLFAVGL